MQELCLHCEQNPHEKRSTLCIICQGLPKCEGCQVIFGEIVKASKENPNRCDTCLNYEDDISFVCVGCEKRLPLFYSPNTNTLHIVVRGNFCGHCNNSCAIEARVKRDRGETPEFLGYLALLAKKVKEGVISAGQFAEAVELNPHDVHYSTMITKVLGTD